MPDSEPFSLSLDLSWTEDEDGVLTVTGCASVPVADAENEIVTKEAIEASLPDFMKLAVLHLDHSERPIGPIKEAWFEGDEFMVKGLIKMTDDCKDVRDRIRSGNLAQFSIFGRRIKGTPACKLNPAHRSEPCVTHALFLDSISICPKGNAINGESYLEHNGGIVQKSTNSTSALVHPTADGVTREKMDDNPQTDPATGDQSADPSILQQILDHVSDLGDRLEEVEERVSSIGSSQAPAPEPEPPVGEPPTEEPGPEDEPGVNPDDEVEKSADAGENDVTDLLRTLGEALQMILSGQEEIKSLLAQGNVQKADLEDQEEYPDDGYEDEDDGQSDEPEDEGEEDIEKCSGIRKSKPEPDTDQIKVLQEENARLNDIVSKARPPKAPVVITEEILQKATKDEKKGKGTSVVSFVSKFTGGV